MIRPLVIGAIAIGALIITADPAAASFNSKPSASATYVTTNLQPATGFTAKVTSCLLGAQTVGLAWTLSTSTFVAGYTITRTGGSAFTPVNVSAATKTYADSSVGVSTTYTYTVTATFDSWSAGVSGSVTTKSILCL